MKIILTPYKINHRDYIWQTYVDAMKHHIEKIWGWNLTWQKDDFIKALDKYTTTVVMLDGNPIGYVQYLKQPMHLYINMIILQPVYQSQGIGAKLLSLIGSIDTNLSLKLRCFKVNDKAYHFYLDYGFKVLKTDDEFYTLVFPSLHEKTQ